MNKTKIDWCDYSWNPVTGCLHGCEYCYARKIANRFGGNFAPIIGEFEGVLYDGDINGVALDNGAIMYDLHKPVINHGRKQPYPAGFMPTFHRYRLDEPQKLKSHRIYSCVVWLTFLVIGYRMNGFVKYLKLAKKLRNTDICS